MPNHWTQTTLGMCADFFSGGTPRKSRSEYWSGAIPWISGKDLKSFYLQDAQDHISLEGAEAGSRLVAPGTILLLVRGMTLHNDVPVAVVTREAAFNQDIKAIRARDHVDQRFLAHWLVSQRPLLLSTVHAAGHGTGVLATDRLKDLPLMLPPLDEQRRIANLFTLLADKIEQNRRTGRKLEALARAVFKAWFVDFEPVKAKAAGATAFPGMPAETFATLPTRLVDSELGPVPEGWRVVTVRDLCARVENGGTPKRKVEAYWTPPEVPWLTSGEVRQPFVMRTENFISKAGLDSSSAKMWPVYTTVVALYGATAGVATMLGVEVCANQACCGLLPKSARCFVHQVLSSSLPELQQRARGSAQQNLSQSIVADFECVTPTDSVLFDFERIVGPFYVNCMHLLAESAKLAALRDYLLPRLLSGRVRVGTAQRAAASAM